MADEDDVVWPWGLTERDPDPASRPWVFRPHGFLVAVVEDAERAAEVEAVLQEAGFPERHLRSYPGQQVLDDRARFLAQQGTLRRVVGEVTADAPAVALFETYARDGRAFVWVRTRDRETANRAIRSLSSCQVLHFRYYGDDTLEDIHVR